MLSSESAAEAGKWQTSRVPWTREPMDASADPDCREIVLEFASQCAKTEVLNNIIGHRIDRDPAPMLAVFPTDRMGQVWSKDRLAPMLRDTPPLRNIVHDKTNTTRRAASSEILEKKFPGGGLAITGANSAAGLAMRPVRDLYGDEVDRWPASAGGKGGDEGDPMVLAGKRTSNFDTSLQTWASSPGTLGRSRIHKRYEQTDQNRWHSKCVHCDVVQILSWENVDFRLDGLEKEVLDRLSNEERAARAQYKCPHCEKYLTDDERHESANRGHYIAKFPNVRAKRGYWVNALCSPWLSMAELVEEWLDAQGDPMLLQVFVTTRLAELWDEGSDRIDAEILLDKVENYPKAGIPNGILMVTAGCDVQKNSIEVSLYGWGLSNECWALEHHVLSADPAELLEGKELTALDDLVLDSKFTREDGVVLPVAATCIDSGGLYYEEVLAFARKRRSKRVYAIRGRGGQHVPLWPLKGATKIKAKKRGGAGRGELYILGVDPGKTALHYSLRKKRPVDWQPGEPAPGFIHFPTRPEFDEEFFAQIAGESPRPRKVKGRLSVEWIQDYPRVEACDCWVYARAAVASRMVNWSKLLARRDNQAAGIASDEDLPSADRPPSSSPDDDDPDDTPTPLKRKAKRKAPRRLPRKRGGFATNY